MSCRRFFLFVLLSLALAAMAVGQTGVITTVAGNPGGYPTGHLSSPVAVVVDPRGNLYIAEQGAVVRAVPGSVVLTTYTGGACTSGPCGLGDGGPAVGAQLNNPLGLALDGSGNLYIADAYSAPRIRRVDAATGIITTVAGNGTAGFSGDNGPAQLASLNQPAGVAVDSAGNLYIADTSNQRIRKVDAITGVITTIAGNGTQAFSGDGGPATSAALNIPTSVAVDAAGNLYIGDYNNFRVRMVNASTGIITTIAGFGPPNASLTIPTSGPGVIPSAGILATNALVQPAGLALDANGNLYISNRGSVASIVDKLTLSTGMMTTVAGNGTGGYSGDGGPATSAELQTPFGLAVDASGNLYIVDTGNNVVREVFFGSRPEISSLSPSTDVAGSAAFTMTVQGANFIPASTVEWNGSPLPTTFVSSTQITASVPAGLIAAAGIASVAVTTPGFVVTDALPFTVFPPVIPAITGISPAYVPAGNAAFTLQIYGSGFLPGAMISWNGSILPANVAPNGSAGGTPLAAVSVPASLIANPGTASVALINPGGDVTTSIPFTIGPNGPLPVIQTVAGSANALVGAIAVDAGGNLYSTAFGGGGYEIERRDAVTGNITTVAGGASTIALGDGGPATSAGLLNPMSVATDSSGNIYIADFGNARVRRVTASTGIITTVAGNGTGAYCGDGGPATSACVNPFGVAVDGSGNLYIADGIISSGFNPVGERIRKVDATTGIITTIAGNGCTTLNCSTGDGGPAISAGLDIPRGMTVDPSGDVYIIDAYRVRKITASTGIITSVAGTQSQTYTGDGIPATSAGFNPKGIALDTSGNLYISDSNSQRVREVNAQTGIVTTVAGNGINAYTGDGGPAIFASLSTPAGLAVDASGNIFVLANSVLREVYSGMTATATISALSPPSITFGEPAFNLTVTGAGFLGGATVYWNGAALQTTVQSPTQALVYVPANLIATPGSASITLANPGSAPTTALTFTISAAIPTPAITSLSPNFVIVGEAPFFVNVNGTGFAGGASVSWNGVSVPTTVYGPTQLGIQISSSLFATAGTVNVTVTNPGGAVSSAVPFTVLAQSTAPPSALRVAHIADGAGWSTTFAIENLDVAPVNYNLNLWSDNGTPLALTLVNPDGTPGVSSGTLPVGSTYFVQSAGVSPTLLEGWAEAYGNGKLGFMALFKYTAPGVPDSQGTVIGKTSATTVSMFYDNTNGYITGLALSNSNPTQPLTITAVLLGDQGGEDQLYLHVPPHGHTAFVLSTIFPASVGTRGTIQFTTTTPDLSVLGERFTPSLSFTTMGTF